MHFSTSSQEQKLVEESKVKGREEVVFLFLIGLIEFLAVTLATELTAVKKVGSSASDD